jgi:DNA-binding XRE family transcriptional regulator
MMQTLGTYLRAYQKKRHLRSVRDLAKAIGVSPPTMYDALADRRVPNSRTAGKYAKALGKPIEAIWLLAVSKS